MMVQLPVFSSETDFRHWRSNREQWSTAVREIARWAEIPATTLSPFATGTNLVVDLDGTSVLKVFPPMFRPQYVSERSTLRHLAGKLSVLTPTLLAEGKHDGWSWLIMTRLEGIVGSEAWPTLPEDDKEAILEEVGRTIAEVQAVPPGLLSKIEPAWSEFIAAQVEGCLERHRQNDLPPRLLNDIPQLLAAVPAVVPMSGPDSILTGEWIPENFLLRETKAGWRLAAVIDFGDVMTGWGEYDLLGPSTFMCAGRSSRVTRLMAGYGLPRDAYDPEMRRRLSTLMLLHRASDLRNIAIDGWEARVQTLFDLEEVIWPA